MILYDQLEDEIVAKLAPLLDEGFEVEALPDNEADTTKPFEKARVTVCYKASEFSPEVVRGLPTVYSTAEGVQDEYADIECMLRGRKLRGSEGLHMLKAKISKLVFGFQPTNWGRVFLKNYSFVDNKDGVWTYALTFTCRCMVVQDFTDGESNTDGDVLLTQATFLINQPST